MTPDSSSDAAADQRLGEAVRAAAERERRLAALLEVWRGVRRLSGGATSSLEASGLSGAVGVPRRRLPAPGKKGSPVRSDRRFEARNAPEEG